jgi:hypothetical protein
MTKRIGDCSRRRRFADPARRTWYAHYRAVRFARRFGGKAFVAVKAVPGATLFTRSAAGISYGSHEAGRRGCLMEREDVAPAPYAAVA